MWSGYGVAYLATALYDAALAMIVYGTGRTRPPSRWLSACLAFECAVFVGYGAEVLTSSVRTAYGLQAVAAVAVVTIPALYLCFIGAAVDGPLARPFRATPVRAVLLAAAAVAAALVVARPELFIEEALPFGDGWKFAVGPADRIAYAVTAAVFLYTLAASVAGFVRAAPGTTARQRAKVFAFAFGTRDLVLAVLFGAMSAREGGLDQRVVYTIVPAAEVVFLSLVAYGILRHQLFDIDLRIKWTISKGTVAAAFVAVFFVVTEIAKTVFEGAAGPIIGALAAGLLVFALAPLQRMAEHVSDAAMPHVRDTSEYRTVRKREVYRAAVESALQDGVVTEKERDVLATLAEQLGLGPAQMRAIERDAAAKGVG